MPNPIPENYPRVTPALAVDGGKKAIVYYTEVFGAKQRGDVFEMPDGHVGHAELQIGDSVFTLSDASEQWGTRAPDPAAPRSVTLMLYVEDVDATVALAKSKGATVVREPSDEFYGDRVANITDPFGHSWHIASHIEDVSDEEMHKRLEAMFAGAEG